jgi:hypothetical protein
MSFLIDAIKVPITLYSSIWTHNTEVIAGAIGVNESNPVSESMVRGGVKTGNGVR